MTLTICALVFAYLMIGVLVGALIEAGDRHALPPTTLLGAGLLWPLTVFVFAFGGAIFFLGGKLAEYDKCQHKAKRGLSPIELEEARHVQRPFRMSPDEE